MLMKIRRGALADWIRRDITQLDKRFGGDGAPELHARLLEFISRAEQAATAEDDDPAYMVAHEWVVWRRRQRYERPIGFLVVPWPVFGYRDIGFQFVSYPDSPALPTFRELMRRRRDRGAEVTEP